MVKCEICESNNIIKENELFVCQNCNCKYTMEQMQELFKKSDNETQEENKLLEKNPIQKKSILKSFIKIIIATTLIITTIFLATTIIDNKTKNQNSNSKTTQTNQTLPKPYLQYHVTIDKAIQEYKNPTIFGNGNITLTIKGNVYNTGTVTTLEITAIIIIKNESQKQSIKRIIQQYASYDFEFIFEIGKESATQYKITVKDSTGQVEENKGGGPIDIFAGTTPPLKICVGYGRETILLNLK
jgi:hypothetical protein